MKKTLLFLSSLCLTFGAFAQNTATFDFTSADALAPVNTGNVVPNPDGNYTDLSGKSFTDGAITLTLDKTPNSYSAPEWYKGNELMVYNNTYIVLKAQGEDCHISRIVFETNQWSWAPDVTATPSVANGYTMDDDTATFTAADNTAYDEVKFDFYDRGKISKITVEYTGNSSGIANIAADTSLPGAEYFNLLGARVSGDSLTPGIYICRQGKHISKILVK